MNLRTILAISALTAGSLLAGLACAETLTTVGRPYDSTNILPGERMIAGPDRDVALAKSALVDTVTVPITFTRQVEAEARAFGPLGLISGVVRGGIKGVIQGARGGSKAIISALDVLTAPMGGLD
jgi:hypothetical protein